MKNTLSFSNAAKAAAACAICAVACLLVGWLSSLFQGESLSQWYPLIKKPSFTPPSMVFPIAWCILYVLSGISAGLVLTSPKEGKTAPILIFCAQLFANFLWSVLFFGMQNPAAGLAGSIVLLILAALYAKSAWKISKTASILFVPYVLWCAFATILNLWIVFLN